MLVFGRGDGAGDARVVEGVAEVVGEGFVLGLDGGCDGPGGRDGGEGRELVYCWRWREAGEAEGREVKG